MKACHLAAGGSEVLKCREGWSKRESGVVEGPEQVAGKAVGTRALEHLLGREVLRGGGQLGDDRRLVEAPPIHGLRAHIPAGNLLWIEHPVICTCGQELSVIERGNSVGKGAWECAICSDGSGAQ